MKFEERVRASTPPWVGGGGGWAVVLPEKIWNLMLSSDHNM